MVVAALCCGCVFQWQELGDESGSNLNGANYRAILNKNLLQSAQDLWLGKSFTFKQDSDSKRTAKATQGWLRDNSMNGLEWASQSPDLKPVEYLWRDLFTDVSHPTWQSFKGYTEKKIPKARCTNFYLSCLLTFIAGKSHWGWGPFCRGALITK